MENYTSIGILFKKNYINEQIVLEPINVVECNPLEGSVYYEVKGNNIIPIVYDSEIDTREPLAIGCIYSKEELIKKYQNNGKEKISDEECIQKGIYQLQEEMYNYLFIQTLQIIDNTPEVETVDDLFIDDSSFTDITTTYKVDLYNKKMYKLAESENGIIKLYDTNNITKDQEVSTKAKAIKQDNDKDNIDNEKSNNKQSIEKKSKTSCKKETKEINLKDIYESLSKDIKGQDKAVKQIVSTIDRNNNLINYRNKTNMLIIGPSGSGKTEIFRTISKTINVPIVIEDSEQYSSTGYVGGDVTDMLIDLYIAANKNKSAAEKGIIVIDEIDKKVTGSKGDVSGDRVINSLLTMMEGNKYRINVTKSDLNPEYVEFDTSRITFVLVGAFSSLIGTEKHIGIDVQNRVEKKYEKITIDDLINFGLSNELLRRVSIYRLKELTVDDLVCIMKSSNNSALKEYYHYAKMKGIKLHINEKAIRKIAEKSILKKTGASSLKATLNDVLNDAFLEVTLNKDIYSSIKITEKSLDQNPPYILTKKRKKN